MTKAPLTRSLESLKREAKAIKKAKACKLHEALDVLSRRYGFGNWALLHKHHPETLAKQPRVASGTPDEMCDWFLDHHQQDTSNPFDNDGVAPPVVDVRQVLERAFAKASPEVLDDVVEQLEEQGDWVSNDVADAINWFIESHERAVNRSPYESKEGGYIFPLVDVHDVISNTFLELSEEDVDAVVQAIEDFDNAWIEGGVFAEEDEEVVMPSMGSHKG